MRVGAYDFLTHAELLGLGVTDTARLSRWGHALVAALTNFAGEQNRETEVAAAMADLDEVLVPAVARVRAAPDHSLLSYLVHAHRERADEDVLPVVRQFAQAQLQSAWVGAWTMAALLRHPEQLAEVRERRWLVGAAVNEALRWSSPVANVTRRTTRAVSLGGVRIPAGAPLSVCVASANRDETIFPDPDRFDVHRDVRTNLGFGTGPHECPAFPYVMATARTAVDVLLDALPAVRRVGDAAPHGWKLRLPGPLYVEWSRP